MICTDFKIWILDRAPERETEAITHAKSCGVCAGLHALDDALEGVISEGLKEAEVPEGLIKKVEMNLESMDAVGKRAGRTPGLIVKTLAPVMAAAAVFLIFILPGPARFESMDEIGRFAVENHLEGMAMEFKSNEVADPARWLGERLDFNVKVPRVEGLTLLGGRKCSLGENDVGYLFYEKDGTAVSLFVVDADTLAFEMPDNRAYRFPVDGSEITLWKEGRLVYASVE
jgi:anti-sigma factor RsiW